jgi:hypothetical protein
MPQYGNYQMYPSIQTQPQYNSNLKNTSIYCESFSTITICSSSGYDHLIRSTAETLAAFTSPSESRQPRMSQQKSTRRPVNNSSGAANSTRVYYCETCRIACGGHASYQAHLNGSKHKKKGLNSQNQQSLVNVNTFRCELCDIICTSSDAYKAHLEGTKHDKVID